MPDWSYRTVFQPLLLRLPFETARELALGSMGRLANLPGGRTVISLMGHMAPDGRLQTGFAGRVLPSPLMLGGSVDPHLEALPAFAQFGFGLLEVGPVGTETALREGSSTIDPSAQSLHISSDSGALDLREATRQLQSARLPRESVVIRFAEPATDNADAAVEHFGRIAAEIAPLATAFALPLAMIADTDAVARTAAPLADALHRLDCVLLVVIDVDRGEQTAAGLAQAALAAGADGVIIDLTRQTADEGIARGADCIEAALSLTNLVRSKLEAGVPVIAGGGVHEPLDAVRLVAAGATMVQIDSGLIFSGPGLPKRCNDALLCLRKSSVQRPASSAGVVHHEAASRGTLDTRHSTLDSRPGRQAWLWTLLMGVALLIGGVMALVIALTRVVMPYDEQFVGMTRAELAAVNDNLLPFMTHDRATLAGTMLALGVLYCTLSWCGIRRGWHWAHAAIIASAFVGFATFFAFLGFGYFDPLHAFVTVVLFQFLLLGVHSERTQPAYDDVPNLTNHFAWRVGLWGQLLYVIHGVLLIVAGGVICTYGMTSVFVPEDLEFMQTTAEALCAANPLLVPLVAHDRATFGGMLIACGITVLLSAMWGYRQGNAWLWWALFAGGNMAYIATILVHWGVGYTDLKHLLPAYGGLLLVWLGSTLSRAFLCRADPSDAADWSKLREGTDQRDLPHRAG